MAALFVFLEIRAHQIDLYSTRFVATYQIHGWLIVVVSAELQTWNVWLVIRRLRTLGHPRVTEIWSLDTSGQLEGRRKYTLHKGLMFEQACIYGYMYAMMRY